MIVDTCRPVNEHLRPEPSLDSAFGGRSGLTVHAQRRAHELFGPDELDTEWVEALGKTEHHGNIVDLEVYDSSGICSERSKRWQRAAQKLCRLSERCDGPLLLARGRGDGVSGRLRIEQLCRCAPPQRIGRIDDLEVEVPHALCVGRRKHPESKAQYTLAQ